MSEQLDLLHERLIALQYLGLRIICADGHRWLAASYGGYEGDWSLDEELQKRGLSANGKVYPNFIGALDYVDYLLKLVEHPSLAETFKAQEHGLGLQYGFDPIDATWETRVHQVELGQGGIC